MGGPRGRGSPGVRKDRIPDGPEGGNTLCKLEDEEQEIGRKVGGRAAKAKGTETEGEGVPSGAWARGGELPAQCCHEQPCSQQTQV